ncbi:hypothetical protein [Persephonella sp.]
MLRIFFSFLLALSIGISTFHHHSDGRLHLDCPVCIFQINNHSCDAGQPPVIPEVREFSAFYSLSEKEPLIPNTFHHFRIRAPPA